MTRLAALAEVPPQGEGALRLQADGTTIGVYRVGDDVVAWRDSCPHARAPVCRGTVAGTTMPSEAYDYVYGRENEVLQCPWHGWEFDLASGEHLAEGSNARLRRYPIEVRGDEVYDDSPAAQRTDLAVQVAERRELTDRIAGFRVTRVDGERFPAWLPGTHVDVELPSGRIRQYSLCGDPGVRSSLEFAVLLEHDGQGGSKEMHETVRTGSALRITAIRNRFRLTHHSAYLLIAAGIGITALRPMITAAVRRGVPMRVLYIGRRRESMALVEELAESPSVTIIETEQTGRPDLAEILASAPDGSGVYACGPAGMMAELERLRSAHTDRIDIVLESFRPRVLAVDPPAETPVDGPISVRLARQGRCIEVGAKESILHALRREGVQIGSSCAEGRCGSCETEVLDGVPDHRDQILTQVERDEACSMMVCVSRARTEELTLDL